MKIVYIADIGIQGGATKSLIELVCTMKENHGVEPIVLTSGNNELNKILNDKGIENYAIGHGAFLQGAPDSWWKKPIKYIIFGLYYYLHKKSSLRNACEVIDWSQVDLIHTNVARDDIGMELGRKFGIPNICHIREFAELDFNCWSYKPQYVRYLNEHTDGFIAISDAVKEYWVKKGLSQDKITVIYNGVDFKRIQVANHDSWNMDKKLKLVIVGGVIPNKGQWQAINAICALPEEIRNNVTLDIVGNVTKEYKKKLLVPAKKIGIENQIHFLNGRNDVHSMLKRYHIGLMCSKAEGFGRVTVEYMRAGLGVIASNTGANKEIIKENYTGLFYEWNNITSLAEKIATYYTQREKLILLAENARNASSVFTKEKNADEIYNIYCDMLFKKRE